MLQGPQPEQAGVHGPWGRGSTQILSMVCVHPDIQTQALSSTVRSRAQEVAVPVYPLDLFPSLKKGWREVSLPQGHWCSWTSYGWAMAGPWGS